MAAFRRSECRALFPSYALLSAEKQGNYFSGAKYVGAVERVVARDLHSHGLNSKPRHYLPVMSELFDNGRCNSAPVKDTQPKYPKADAAPAQDVL